MTNYPCVSLLPFLIYSVVVRVPWLLPCRCTILFRYCVGRCPFICPCGLWLLLRAFLLCSAAVSGLGGRADGISSFAWDCGKLLVVVV